MLAVRVISRLQPVCDAPPPPHPPAHPLPSPSPPPPSQSNNWLCRRLALGIFHVLLCFSVKAFSFLRNSLNDLGTSFRPANPSSIFTEFWEGLYRSIIAKIP